MMRVSACDHMSRGWQLSGGFKQVFIPGGRPSGGLPWSFIRKVLFGGNLWWVRRGIRRNEGSPEVRSRTDAQTRTQTAPPECIPPLLSIGGRRHRNGTNQLTISQRQQPRLACAIVKVQLNAIISNDITSYEILPCSMQPLPQYHNTV